MTSNMGAHLIQDKFDGIEDLNDNQRFDVIESTKNQVFELLRKTIRPEFLNRIDETIMFQPLTRENITAIVKIQFKSLQKRLKESDIQLIPTDEAINWIATKGYDPQFGARPVKRVIQREVLNELSKAILGGTVSVNSVVELSIKDNKLEFITKTKQEELVEN
jgi:ATP-dependent Clp protease ATP-binding subunit ClpB